MNINFEIVEINRNKGIAMVKYWADGATVERFHADIGPYSISINQVGVSMTEEELLQSIADFGKSIVKKQIAAMESDNNGTTTKYENLIGTVKTVEVETEI